MNKYKTFDKAIKKMEAQNRDIAPSGNIVWLPPEFKRNKEILRMIKKAKVKVYFI